MAAQRIRSPWARFAFCGLAVMGSVAGWLVLIGGGFTKSFRHSKETIHVDGAAEVSMALGYFAHSAIAIAVVLRRLHIRDRPVISTEQAAHPFWLNAWRTAWFVAVPVAQVATTLNRSIVDRIVTDVPRQVEDPPQRPLAVRADGAFSLRECGSDQETQGFRSAFVREIIRFRGTTPGALQVETRNRGG